MSPEISIPVSFVIPCLNESQTLGEVIGAIQSVAPSLKAGYEIVVSDNGSTDNSVEIARRLNARVAPCAERGYGAALKNGIESARNPVVVFADADNTYDFKESLALLKEMQEHDVDMVVGSRLDGRIFPGAMPLLHRYVGTPVLTFLINFLFSSRANRIRDCNSGFRCFKKTSYQNWGIRSSGMEFASEMLVKALKNRASVRYVPISLRPDTRGRIPHLKTWRDGMRHLLQILLEAPHLFFYAGVGIFAVFMALLVAGCFVSPIKIGSFSVLGIHTMMFCLLMSVVGTTIWSIGLFITAREKGGSRVYRALLEMPEDRLFWLSVALGAVSLSMIGYVFWVWYRNSFSYLSLSEFTLFTVTLSLQAVLFIFHLVCAHIIQRTR